VPSGCLRLGLARGAWSLATCAGRGRPLTPGAGGRRHQDLAACTAHSVRGWPPETPRAGRPRLPIRGHAGRGWPAAPPGAGRPQRLSVRDAHTGRGWPPALPGAGRRDAWGALLCRLRAALRPHHLGLPWSCCRRRLDAGLDLGFRGTGRRRNRRFTGVCVFYLDSAADGCVARQWHCCLFAVGPSPF
jgi:hypothetical protein